MFSQEVLNLLPIERLSYVVNVINMNGLSSLLLF